MKLFGFEFGARKKAKTEISPNDVIRGQQQPIDVVVTASAGGFIQHSATVGLIFEEDRQQIEQYRTMACDAYLKDALHDIINEAVDQDETSGKIISLDLRATKKISVPVKKEIEEEFVNILNMMEFNQNAEEYFKEWLIDGKHFFYLIPHENTRLGFKEIRKIDALYIKRVMKIEHDPSRSALENAYNPSSKICYFYSRPTDLELSRSNYLSVSFMSSHVKTSDETMFEITQDAIAYSDSGELTLRNQIKSILHNAIKPFNQLSMMEDSTIIYSMSRAPERRVWYIGTGDLSPTMAAEYIKNLMRQYTSTDVYNTSTGTMNDKYEIRSMLEDIWIPRGSQEGKNTEVTTLDSGKALQDKMEHVDWFKKKVYKVMGIPESRLSPDATYQFGRSAEIVRDEVKFAKYINVLRRKFSEALLDILKKQLILRKIVSEDEWNEIKCNSEVKWHGVSYFREMKSLELWDAKLNMFDRMNALVGTYISKEFVYENVLRMSTEEQDKEQKRIKKEMAAGETVPMATGAIGNDSIPSEYSDGVTSGNQVDQGVVGEIPDRELEGLDGESAPEDGEKEKPSGKGFPPAKKKKDKKEDKEAKD